MKDAEWAAFGGRVCGHDTKSTKRVRYRERRVTQPCTRVPTIRIRAVTNRRRGQSKIVETPDRGAGASDELHYAVEATSSTTPPKQIHKVPLECRVPRHGERQINQRLDLLIQRRRGEGPLLRHGVGRCQRYLLPLFLFGRIRDGPSTLTGL